ncbi:MAG: type ISP restriction/modification enzyme, partial [Patescibacteria group bacterium]
MSRANAVEAYFKELTVKHRTGQAAEHTYRPAFSQLITDLDPKINPMNDPKRSEHGAPDFVFIRKPVTVGYAETKDIGQDLDKTEKSEQMKRYFGYSNLILTDYLEFRFFKNGERHGESISIGKVVGDVLRPNPDSFAILADALTDFLKGEPEPIRSGAQLAKIMGGKARRIRDNVRRYLDETSEKNEELLRIYETVKKLLVHDLSTEKFADMYAQTLVYGLFVARYNDETPQSFSRQEARDLVPASNPFLREFFDHIVGPKFDTRLGFIVDELCVIFSVSDVKDIIHRHLNVTHIGTSAKDPIIHFYEDFLKEYDPEVRKKMGAYYTPIPVVRFIIRSVDEILKRDFGLAGGLADTSKRQVTITTQGMKPKKVDIHRVQILDPAVGTATFLNELIWHVHSGFAGQEGRWPSYVENDLLPRLHGFEIMMAPYTIAHLKLGITLRETGCKQLDHRLGVYLTNSLEEGVKVDGTLFGLGLSQSIADEAAEAGKIKHEKPIMVVIGNPPYSGVSSNETDYANSIIAKYKVEPGGKMKLQERKHWLNDDYVKFIAFAEDMIEKNGEGIVAMITNHGYLDNPTFRGMRWHLAKTFDSIHVLDLHGNTKKKESAPDGSKDENVFEIQQGVAILVAVKTGKKKTNELAKVYCASLFGKRENKFTELNTAEQNWHELTLDKEFCFFSARNLTGSEKYRSYVAVNSLFPKNVTGIVTAKDSFVIDISKQALLDRITRFTDSKYSDEETRAWIFPNKPDGKYSAGDSRGWKLALARKAIANENHDKLIQPISYRPFDIRHIYYSPKMVDWGRFELMPNFLKGENIGLVASRLNRQASLGYFFVTK